MKHIIAIVSMTFISLQVNADAYSFGIVPQQSAHRTAELWVPILNEISRQTGVKLSFETAKNIPEFEQNLANNEYDFAYMNPYHYSVYRKAPGYRAIATRKNQPIKGIIVTHIDSQVASLSELQGGQLAFPSPAAFAASILPRANLKNNAVKFTSQYVSSHDSVYLGVSKKLFPAGGGILRTLNNIPDAVRSKLKILWTSDGYTPHAFAVSPNIEPNIKDKVQQALINLHKTEKGKALLKKLRVKEGLRIPKETDWNDIDALNIELLE